MNIVEPALLPDGVCAADVTAIRNGARMRQSDWLAEEIPVALVFNGVSHAVMLATPADLEDFALGFALSERLLVDPAEFRDVEVVAVADGIELRIEISSAAEWRLRNRRRNLAGRTGCGLCGTDSLAAVRQTLRAVPAVGLSPDAVRRSQQALRQWQRLQQLTGATHAAAWCGLEGDVLLAREDIGRHNALDKLIGAMQRAQVDSQQGYCLITSRASFEMVQKSANMGIAALAAVSAPTAMAVAQARDCGQLLLGFVRGNDLVAYTFPDRLRGNQGVDTPSAGEK